MISQRAGGVKEGADVGEGCDAITDRSTGPFRASTLLDRLKAEMQDARQWKAYENYGGVGPCSLELRLGEVSDAPSAQSQDPERVGTITLLINSRVCYRLR